MRRGEVWWAELPPPVGNRPVLVLTRDSVVNTIGAVVVALVTRTVRELPTEVVLGRRQGLPVRCVANLDNVLTVVPTFRLRIALGNPSLQNSGIRAQRETHSECWRSSVGRAVD